jgi:hypothetical protein
MGMTWSTMTHDPSVTHFLHIKQQPLVVFLLFDEPSNVHSVPPGRRDGRMLQLVRRI